MIGCPYEHTGKKPDGQWYVSDHSTFGLVLTGNRLLQIKAVCNNCRTKSGALPTTLVKELGLRAEDLKILTVHNPTQYPDCTVKGCHAPGVDIHHFAPRNTFGPAADEWPELPLCREHHIEWHRRMDGYRWHATYDEQRDHTPKGLRP